MNADTPGRPMHREVSTQTDEDQIWIAAGPKAVAP